MNSPFSILKYFLGFCVFAVFGGFLVIGFLGEPKQETVLAQAPYLGEETLVQDWMSPGGFGGLECDVPLPLGEAFEHTRELIASTSDEFFNAQGYLQSATEILKGLTAKLNEEQGSVCDFTRCSPQVTDRGPDFVLEVDTWVKSWELGGHASICKAEECSGQPCPSLDEYVKGLEAAKANFDTSHQNIIDIFDKPSIAVTEDLRTEDDEEDQEITKSELARREMTSVEATLTPSATGIWVCSLSELEQRKWLAGEIGNKFPMPCKEAIEQGLYWPRPWSENCQQECEEGESKKCADCLGKKDPGPKSSVLARINYKIYGACKDKCSEEINPISGEREWGFSDKCEGCLCSEKLPPVAGSGGITGGATKEWSQEECQAWLCSASSNPAGLKNWVCCHETPLTGQEVWALMSAFDVNHHPEADPTHPEYNPELIIPAPVTTAKPCDPAVDDGCKTVDTLFKMTAYSPPCHPQGQCTATMVKAQYGLIAVPNKGSIIPTGSRVWLAGEVGKGKVSDTEVKDILQSFNLFGGAVDLISDFKTAGFCACDTGNKVMQNSQHIDIWLPDYNLARKDWGVKWAKLKWKPDPTCCQNKSDCCRIKDPEQRMDQGCLRDLDQQKECSKKQYPKRDCSKISNLKQLYCCVNEKADTKEEQDCCVKSTSQSPSKECLK